MISLEIPNFAMFSWIRMHLCIILWTYVVLTYAKLINVTVDDQNGDPITSAHVQYSSLADWDFNPNCTDCRAMFDPNQAYMGTWHNASYDAGVATQHPENATFDFTGRYQRPIRLSTAAHDYHPQVQLSTFSESFRTQ